MAKLEYLDPSIANEGVAADRGVTAVIPAWDDEEEYQPMIEPPHIPDYKGIEAIKKYFPQYSGRPYRTRPFPAWLYHKTQEAKLVNNPAEAAQLGATWIKDEFRFECKGEWRSKPFSAGAKPEGPGKTLTSKDKGSTENTADLIAAAVTATLAKLNQNGAAPKVQQVLATDPDFEEFQRFKAFKAKTETPTVAAEYADEDAEIDVVPDEKTLLIEAAAAKGIKLDKRWGLDKIKSALEEAA